MAHIYSREARIYDINRYQKELDLIQKTRLELRDELHHLTRRSNAIKCLLRKHKRILEDER